MLDRIRILYDFNQAYGIACFLDQNGSPKLSFSSLEREGDQLDVIENSCFNDWDSLFSFLKNKKLHPIAVQLQGRGILIKESKHKEVSLDSLLGIFPNYNEVDFFYFKFDGIDTSWICFVRKELVIDIVNLFKDNGFDICKLYLGPFVAENVLEQLNGYSGSYCFDGHKIDKDIEKGLWEKYAYAPDEKAKFTIKLGTVEIKEQFVISYAAAFSMIMYRYVQDFSLLEAGIRENFQEARSKIRFMRSSFLALGIILLLLIVNIIIFSIYTQKSELLKMQHQERFTSQNELDQLENKGANQDSMLLSLGWNGGITKGFILRKIAESLSENDNVNLTKITINPPVDKRVANSQDFSENLNKIMVFGECLGLNNLDSWLKRLRNSSWISKVEVVGFSENNEPNNKFKQFVVNLEFNHDF